MRAISHEQSSVPIRAQRPIERLDQGLSMSRYQIKDIRSVVNELQSENDRSAIIVGAAMLDAIMEDFIRWSLSHLPQAENDRAFSDNGLLGTFSRKVFWLYATGAIGKKTHHDLDMIRRIRNEAAHNPDTSNFDAQEIKTRALTIEISKSEVEENNARARFVGAVNILSTGLLFKAASNKIKDMAQQLKAAGHDTTEEQLHNLLRALDD